jgi:hypothetical protein
MSRPRSGAPMDASQQAVSRQVKQQVDEKLQGLRCALCGEALGQHRVHRSCLERPSRGADGRADDDE